MMPLKAFYSALPANRTREPSRAGGILLAYREDPSFFAVGQALGLHHQTVQRCVERAVAAQERLIGDGDVLSADDVGAGRVAHGRRHGTAQPINEHIFNSPVSITIGRR